MKNKIRCNYFLFCIHWYVRHMPVQLTERERETFLVDTRKMSCMQTRKFKWFGNEQTENILANNN